MRNPLTALFAAPVFRRIGFHAKRIGGQLDRHLPDDYVGLTIDELSAKLRGEHRATLLAVTRNGASMTNPSADFRLEPGDDAVVVAESLGELQPLALQQA